MSGARRTPKRNKTGKAASRKPSGTAAKAVPRSEAVTRLAAHYESRDAWLAVTAPAMLGAAAEKLGNLPGCSCWLDNGTDAVLVLAGAGVAALPVLMDMLPPQVPAAGVLAVPKSVSAAALSAALGQDIPADGSQDLILLAPPDTGEITWPLCLVQAIARSDPEAAASLVRADRDRQLGDAAPAVRALVDQADAAAAHGLGILAAVAEHEGGTFTQQAPPALVLEIAGRFAARAAAGQLGLCPHVSPAAPEPAFWSPWAPDLVRCVRCNAEAGEAIKGTDEDQRCDYCRTGSAVIHNEMAMLPAVVADLPGAIAASGPVILMFGLCPACHEKAYPEGDRTP